MKHRFGLFAVLLGLLAGAPALAQDDDFDYGEPVKPVLDGRPYYVSPMFSFSRADSDRGTDDFLGGVISVGKKVTRGMTLELTGTYQQADWKSGGGTVDLSGAGIGAMIFPFTSSPNFYAVLALMYGSGDDQPRTPAGTSGDYTSTIFDIGAGYLFSLTPRVALRAEARYRTDQHDDKQTGVNPGSGAFSDGLLNLGLMFPLGHVPPPEEETIEVVETVAVVDDTDSDGDGVPDSRDQCPDTPAGTTVNDVGCPLDSDGDGIPDDLDECPNSPPGAAVLANGCALQGDCRRPRPGEQVDENGCAAQSFVLRGVKFEFDSDRLTPEAKTILNDVGTTLQSYPSVAVDLEGHTDNIGTDAYNQGLSERRANAVKTYLVGRGLDGKRMTPVGYGKTQPIATNDTEEGRDENRRVELSVNE